MRRVVSLTPSLYDWLRLLGLVDGVSISRLARRLVSGLTPARVEVSRLDETPSKIMGLFLERDQWSRIELHARTRTGSLSASARAFLLAGGARESAFSRDLAREKTELEAKAVSLLPQTAQELARQLWPASEKPDSAGRTLLASLAREGRVEFHGGSWVRGEEKSGVLEALG